MAVIMNTSLGDIVIDLHSELCPLAAKNFLKLCKLKYYNNCLFHDVAKDFIAQTGDPTGTGSGGDSVYKYLYGDQARFFNDEFHPKLTHSKIGTVAMASGGENMNASQFYITLRDGLDYLDGKHTVFGEVAEGLETLARINEAFVDDKGRPFKNIRIKHVDILDDPFEDPPQLLELIPDTSPELKPPAEGEEVRLEDDWVPLDEQMDPEELDKSLRKKEALSRAVVLEMIGDLPEAEVAPPENVLFICKLNPVTEEGDLETIFSRFGKIVAADIIRDYKTGDSLCYGFIEFENKESCEAAYFKMDNVLIDDRRIHVDFSQSVARLWTRFRKFGSKDVDQGGGRAPANGKGGGCFNCGEYGHLQKDCPNTKDGGSEKDAAPAEKPKYVLKESAGQRGQSRSRYEMVFEDDVEPPHSDIVKDSTKSRSRHATTRMPSKRGSGDYDDAKRARSRFAVNEQATDSRQDQARSRRHRNEEGSTDSDDRETEDRLLDERGAEPLFSSRDRTNIARGHGRSDERLRERRGCGRHDLDVVVEKRARSSMSFEAKQDSGPDRARKSGYREDHYMREKDGSHDDDRDKRSLLQGKSRQQYVESRRDDFVRNNQHRDRAARERSDLFSDGEKRKRDYDERGDMSQIRDHYRTRRKERHDSDDEERTRKSDRDDRSQRSRKGEQDDRDFNVEHRKGSLTSPSTRGQDGSRSHYAGKDDRHRPALVDGSPASNEEIKMRRRSPLPARERHVERRSRPEKLDHHRDRYAKDR